jgi:acyl carrier protein
MDIYQKVVDAIVDEMELSPDGADILRKAAEKPEDFGHLAEGLGVDASAVTAALTSKDPAALTVADVAGELGVDADAVTKLLWTNARFREDMEADSLDLVGLIIALENLSEEEFGVKMEIPDEDAQNIASVGSAIAYLEQILADAGGGS